MVISTFSSFSHLNIPDGDKLGVVSEATFFYQKHFTNYITHVGV